jgi:hypothetical protein
LLVTHREDTLQRCLQVAQRVRRLRIQDTTHRV